MKKRLSYAEEVRSRILGKSWLKDFVTPDYDEYCISNIPATLTKIFHIPHLSGNPLADPEVKPVLEDVSRVVLLLVDALSYTQLLKAFGGGDSILQRFFDRSVLLPLTSTFPSTTPPGLTSLNTGLTPQQHAVIGYSLYLKQFGLVANMVNFSPSVDFRRDTLREIGLDPNEFLNAKTLYEFLGEEGYPSYVVTRWFYRNSTLTNIIHKGAKIETYVDTPDLFITLRRLLESRPTEESYIFAYWDTLDTASHVYGPASEEAEAEIRSLAYSLKTEFLDRLDKSAVKNTLLLITSDHGGHTLVDGKTVIVPDHPELLRDLQIPPTGSSRSPYFYPKPGRFNSVRRYLTEKFGDGFLLLESEEALKKGLFGVGEVADETRDRIGDLLALPREGHSIFYPYKPHREELILKGGHGGLSEDEMLVPFLALPLEKAI
ncbi:MAG: alkaline phosphatase family protein [Nitrososphaerales archaeon]